MITQFKIVSENQTIINLELCSLCFKEQSQKLYYRQEFREQIPTTS